MPQLSVIVHGPNTQDHLTGLLDSLVAHPLPDVEVVVAAVGDWARETAERHTPHAPRQHPPDLRIGREGENQQREHRPHEGRARQ